MNSTAKSSTSIRVIWGPVTKELQNGLILGYNVTYKKQGSPSSSMKYIDVKGEHAKETVISGLEKYTMYNISIVAYTNKGPGNESTYAKFSARTGEDGKYDIAYSCPLNFL